MSSLPLKKPSEKSVRVPLRTERFHEKCSVLDGTVSSNWFARIPAAVLLDERLTTTEKVAYGVMALGVQRYGNKAQIGMRLLGRSVSKRSPVSAARWIAKLEKLGHIRRKKGAKGLRNGYEFTSTVFVGAGSALETEDLGAIPKPIAEVWAPPVPCGHCHRPVRQLGKSGWCRTCVNDQNRLRQWEAAKVELGPAATEEQIAQHLHIRKLTATWRKVIRRAA